MGSRWERASPSVTLRPPEQHELLAHLVELRAEVLLDHVAQIERVGPARVAKVTADRTEGAASLLELEDKPGKRDECGVLVVLCHVRHELPEAVEEHVLHSHAMPSRPRDLGLIH